MFVHVAIMIHERELRELIRYRRSLIEERAAEVNRIQKVLEGANIKLSSVASDVLGKSGRAILEAMIRGEENPEVLSELAQRGNNESAGKRKSSKTRKGNQKLRAALVEAARAAARSKTAMPLIAAPAREVNPRHCIYWDKETYLSSQYHRIAGRRGANRAAVAVAHSILTITYHLLSKRQPYRELGATYFEERKKDAVVKQSIRRLEALGYKVTIQPVA